MAINVGDLLATIGLDDRLTPALVGIGDGLGRFTDSLARATYTMLPFEAAIIGVSAAVLELGSTVIEAAARYETALTKIDALTTLSTESIQQWNMAIIKMSVSVPEGPGQLAEGMFFVASHGIQGAEALDTLAVSAQAAATGLGTTGDIARVVTAQMNAYHDSAMTAAQVTDILTETVKQGGMRVSDLVGSLARVTPVASAMNIQLADVGAFIATFTRLGVSADVAATSLRGFLSGILKDGPKSAAALAQVGLSAKELREIVAEQGLAQALGLIIEKFEAADKMDVLAQAIPNIKSLTGVLATAGSQGEAYLSIQEKIRNSSGATAEAFKLTAGTLAFQWKTIGSAIEAAATILGMALLPAAKLVASALTELTAGLIKVSEWFAKLPQSVLTLGSLLIAATAAIAPFAVGILGLIIALPALEAGFVAGIAALVKFDDAMVIAGEFAGTTLGVAYVSLTGIVKGLGITFLEVVPTVLALWAAFETGAEAGKKLVVLGDAIHGIKDPLKEATDEVGIFTAAWQELKEAPAAFMSLMGGVGGGGGFWSGLVAGIKDSYEQLKPFVEMFHTLAEAASAVGADIERWAGGRTPDQIAKDAAYAKHPIASGRPRPMDMVQNPADRLAAELRAAHDAGLAAEKKIKEDRAEADRQLARANEELKGAQKTLAVEWVGDLAKMAAASGGAYAKMNADLEASAAKRLNQAKDNPRLLAQAAALNTTERALAEYNLTLSVLGPGAAEAQQELDLLTKKIETNGGAWSFSQERFSGFAEKIKSLEAQGATNKGDQGIKDRVKALDDQAKAIEKELDFEAEYQAMGEGRLDLQGRQTDQLAKSQQVEDDFKDKIKAIAQSIQDPDISDGLHEWYLGFQDVKGAIPVTQIDQARKNIQEMIDLGKKVKPGDLLKTGLSGATSKEIEGWKQIADAVNKAADAVGGKFGSAISLVGSMLDAIAYDKASVQLTKWQQITKAVQAATAAVAIYKAASQDPDEGRRAKAGAVSGAQAGAAYGPVGLIIGAMAGFVLATFFGPSWENIWVRAADTFGGEISNELAKAIERSKNTLELDANKANVRGQDWSGLSNLQGSAGLVDYTRDYLASLLHITDAMSELKDRTAESFAPLISSLIENIRTGAIPAAQGIKELGSAFSALRSEAEAMGKTGSTAMTQLIMQARAAGVASKAMKDYTNERVVAAMDASSTIFGKVEDNKIVGGMDIKTEEDAAEQATIFTTIFWATVKEKGLLFAVKGMKDSFDALRQRLEGLGFDVGALLGPVAALFNSFDDPAIMAAAEKLDALTTALSGLGDAGYLSIGSLDAFSTAILRTIGDLEKAGMSEAEALAAGAPAFAQLLEMHKRYGIALSEEEQALADRYEQAGIVFAADPIFAMVDAVHELIDAIREMNGLPPRDWGTGPPVLVPGTDDKKDPKKDFSEGSGGIRDWGRETRNVALHGMEAVMTVPEINNLIVSSRRAGRSSAQSGGITVGTIVLQTSNDPKVHAQQFLAAVKSNAMGIKQELRRYTR